jgi:hypothetical protein
MTTGNSNCFQLGHFECMAINDGSVSYPLRNVFANVPAPEIEVALARRNVPVDFVTTPCSLLYAEAGKHRLLVDVGAGTLWPSAGRLPQNLRAAGVEPADIAVVILTHAHPGHVGGILGSDGIPVYDHAHYYIAQDEWESWTSEAAFTKAPERHVVIARNSLPKQAAATKSCILGRAAESKTLVMGHHLAPFPGLGYVSGTGSGWRWQPIEATA